MSSSVFSVFMRAAIASPIFGDLVGLLAEHTDVGVGIAHSGPVFEREQTQRPHGIDAVRNAADLAPMGNMFGEKQKRTG